MDDKENKSAGVITPMTLIPLSFITIVIGFVLWLASIKAEADATGVGLGRIENAQKAFYKVVMDIDERLSRIEGKLDRDREHSWPKK